MKLKTIILFLIVILLLSGCHKEYKKYSETIKINDKSIKVTFYSSNPKKANTSLKEIKKIYKEYYNILNNKKISKKYLQDIKDYASSWYKDSNNYISLYSNQVVNDWNNKKYNKKYNFDEENDKNINLAMIIDGLANKKVYDYLNKAGIKKYIIQNDANVLTGLSNDNKAYRVGVLNPFDDSMLHLFLVNNKYIVTKSINNNYIKKEHKKYSIIVNTKTGRLSHKNVSVTVISKDPLLSDFLATTLFVMDYKIGKEFISNYEAKAIWCFKENDSEIIKYSKNLDDLN